MPYTQVEIREVLSGASGLSRTSSGSAQAGDLVILGTFSVAGAGVPTFTIANGFTSLANQSHDDGSTDGRMAAAGFVATTGGAVAYQAWTSSGGTTYTGGLILKKGTFPSDWATSITVASASNTATTAANPPAVSGTQGGLAIAFAGWHMSSAATGTISAPSGYTEQWELSGSVAAEMSCATKVLTLTQSEDPGTFTDNVSQNGSITITLGIPPHFIAEGFPNTIAEMNTATGGYSVTWQDLWRFKGAAAADVPDDSDAGSNPLSEAFSSGVTFGVVGPRGEYAIRYDSAVSANWLGPLRNATNQSIVLAGVFEVTSAGTSGGTYIWREQNSHELSLAWHKSIELSAPAESLHFRAVDGSGLDNVYVSCPANKRVAFVAALDRTASIHGVAVAALDGSFSYVSTTTPTTTNINTTGSNPYVGYAAGSGIVFDLAQFAIAISGLGSVGTIGSNLLTAAETYADYIKDLLPFPRIGPGLAGGKRGSRIGYIGKIGL